MNRSVLALIGAVAACTVASAATILSVDLDGGGNHITYPGPTETPGFLGSSLNIDTSNEYQFGTFATAAVSSGQVSGSYAYTGPGTGTFGFTRDRGAIADNGAFTYGDLYRDFFAFGNNSSTAETARITLAGLDSSSAYDVTLYSYDSGRVVSGITQRFVSGSASADINWGSSVTGNSQFAVTLRVMSGADGKITIDQSVLGDTDSGNSRVVLNGFQLASVPEPTSLGLLAGATALLLGRRRK